MYMRKWILFSVVCIVLTSCVKKNEEAALTPTQEIQMVDSATNETNARIDSLSNSVDELQKEVDSLLNENK